MVALVTVVRRKQALEAGPIGGSFLEAFGSSKCRKTPGVEVSDGRRNRQVFDLEADNEGVLGHF